MRTLPKHTNRAQSKSTDELTAMTRDVLSRAKKKGATDVSVSVNHDRGFSVDVRMRQAEAVAFNEDKGVGVTVYIGQRKGTASSSDTSSPALDAMVSAAYDIAKVSAEDPCFGLPDRELMMKNDLDLDVFHPWEIKSQEAIEMALRCEGDALGLDKRIVNSDGVNLSTHVYCHAYATSQGFESMEDSSYHSVSCSLIAKDGKTMQRDDDYTAARNADDLMSLEALATSAVERAISRLGAKKLKTQDIPVLFSSRLSSGLLSSFVNAISGSNLYRKNSFLLDALGQQIFPVGVRIHEQPYLLRGLGSSLYDGEGVPTRNNIFVEDGKLCQYALSSYSARKLGLKTTANSGGVFNLTFDATDGDEKDMLQKLGRGLLVTELMGQGVNVLTGDYSRAASGFWVDGGEIQYPVEEITIAGNLKEMFHRIVAVGNDINPNIATRCGSVLIEKMMVSGS